MRNLVVRSSGGTVKLPTLVLHSLGTRTIRYPAAVQAPPTGSATKELTHGRHARPCNEPCQGGLRNSSFSTKTAGMAGSTMHHGEKT
jgi:hypothetical protein